MREKIIFKTLIQNETIFKGISVFSLDFGYKICSFKVVGIKLIELFILGIFNY